MLVNIVKISYKVEMSLIDTHCHLQHFLNDNTLNLVLDRARNTGVSKIITVGTNQDDWASYYELAIKNHDIFYTIGLHPCYVDENWKNNIERSSFYWKCSNPPIALGEIGLDYFHLPKNKIKSEKIKLDQKESFLYQLQIAKVLNCPVVIHSRNSFEDCLNIIDQSGVNWHKIVFHCFSEGAEQIKEILKRGGRASFTGNITYKKNSHLLDAIKTQGYEKLMIETDSPYLAPEPDRKSLNEPCRLRETFDFISKVFDSKNLQLEEVIYSN